MSKYSEIIERMRESEYIDEKNQTAQFFLQILDKVKDDLYPDERADITDFAVGELSLIKQNVLNANNYKEKSLFFAYEYKLLNMIADATGFVGELPEERLAIIRSVEEFVKSETTVEDSIDSLFAKDEIGLADVNDVLSLVSGIDDIFRRSLLFVGLLKYKDDIEKKFSDDAWKVVSDYTLAELDRFISKKDKASELDTDDTDSLEVAVDACKCFMTDDIANKITTLLSFGYNRVNYYAVETLLETGREVSRDVVESLARDLEYAEITYSVLQKYKRAELFPNELCSEEYLAKSKMIRWLVFPTELGRKPDEIECLGHFKIKKEEYYIFKFRSDSDTLNDELKGEWLVGWTSNDGDTFSQFDRLSAFEDKKHRNEKTLKNIKRYLK